MMAKLESIMGVFGVPIGRVLIGVLFAVAGYQKLTDIETFAGFVGMLGVPAPEVLAWVVVAIELLGGIALILGFMTRIAAEVLLVFVLIATYLAHPIWSDPSQMGMFLKNLAVMGGLLYVAAFGAGKWSLGKNA